MSSFRLLYSEICSYYMFIDEIYDQMEEFSSPIFGDMFLLQKIYHAIHGGSLKFSSPIFGDMFLLHSTKS